MPLAHMESATGLLMAADPETFEQSEMHIRAALKGLPFLEHHDLVPIAALFGEGRDPNAEVEYRRLLAVADLIFGVDVMSGKQFILFGRMSLEELVLTVQSNTLGVVNVGLDQERMEIEKLATLVQDIKGHHDYLAASPR